MKKKRYKTLSNVCKSRIHPSFICVQTMEMEEDIEIEDELILSSTPFYCLVSDTDLPRDIQVTVSCLRYMFNTMNIGDTKAHVHNVQHYVISLLNFVISF